MRIDIRKATPWACLLALAFCASIANRASADAFHVIPKSVPGIDVNTGEPYMAPPIPYGHYAKSPSDVFGKHLGCLTCGLGGLHNKMCGLCSGKGCSSCCGTGVKDGCGHGHKGGGLGHGGSGCGGLFHHGAGASACGTCGGAGCGTCLGNGGGLKGLFNKPFGHKGLCAAAMASPQSIAVAPSKTHPIRVHSSAQAPGRAATYPVASAQGGAVPSHQHGGVLAGACSTCGGKGCGLCGKGLGGGLLSKLCHGCGGKGCGMCGGKGLLHGQACDQCGGKGCGHCGFTGFLKKLCSFCGGKGCKFCGGGHALLSKLTHPFNHGNKIKYFVGAGGPVPLTPGYVPYVVTTRSPRDYFAFPPFSDIDP